MPISTVKTVILSLFFLSICGGTSIYPSGQFTAAPAGWTLEQRGAYQILTPADRPPGKVSITIGPEERLSDIAIEDWLARRVSENSPAGTLVERGKMQRTNDDVVNIANVYQERGGRFVVLYLGLIKTDGNVQLAIVKCPADRAMMQKYIAQSGHILAALQKASPAAPEATSKPTPPAKVTPSPADQKLAAIRATQPGAGVPDSQIAALLHEGKGVTTATGYQYQESVDLLLKDGTAYSGLKIPPEDLNAAASRRLEADQWHRWRQQGNDYYFQNNKTGQWEKVDGRPVKPLDPGARLNREVIYRRAISFVGMGGSVFTKDFHFFANGRYERSDSSLHGTGGVQAAGGFSGNASSLEDKNGRQGTAAGIYSGPNGTAGATSHSHSGTGGSDFSGSYEVKGYALELHSDSGRVERVLAFYPLLKPNDADIFIGDVTYNPRR